MSTLFPFSMFFRHSRKNASPSTLTFALKDTPKKCGRCRYVRNVFMGLLTLPFTVAAIGGFFALAYMPRIALDNLEFFGRHTPIGCLALNALHEGARKGPVFAYDEPEVGLIAVGVVAQNRLKLGFRQGNQPKPTSVCDVVWAPMQFSWTLYSHDRIFKLPKSDEARFRRAFWASREVLMDTHKARVVKSFLCDADHYLNPNALVALPGWVNAMQNFGFYGNHMFLADTGRYTKVRQLLREQNCPGISDDEAKILMASR